MIPASCKESVLFTDQETGVVYRFKPKTGVLDRRVMNAALSKMDTLTAADELDKLVDEIVVGWDDVKKIGLPPFGVNKVSEIFNSTEKWELIGFWNKANELTGTDRKN